MLRPNTLALTLLLAALTSIGPLSVDMYLASLPDIGRQLASPAGQVQLTLSVYLIGFAVGQVIYGPVSDRHGRRTVLLTSLAVFSAASLVCTAASSIDILIVARFFQAIGGAGTVVLARAVARDLYDGAQLARELSRMAAVMALAPLVAPLIGGVLQTIFGWRANFIVLVGFGMGAATLVWLLLPETLRERAPEPISFVSILRAYRKFARNRVFLAHVGIVACGVGGLFAWISTAAFVLQDIYGLSALEFGVAFTIGSAGYLVGTWLAAHFVVRMGIDRVIGLGSLGLAAGGLASMLTLGFGFASATALVMSMALYLAGLGLALPQAQAGALLPFAQRAGAASSLVGFSQQTSGALVGAVVGFLLGQNAWPLTIAVAIMGCLAFVLWAFTRKLRARQA